MDNNDDDRQDFVDDGYQPPAQKSVKEILETDAEDPSLQKYKETLLGKNANNVVVDPNNPKNVIVKQLALLVDGRPDVVMDLSDIGKLERQTFTLKEDCKYRLEIRFFVQREIVSGLRYMQHVSRLGINVGREGYMVGSYSPSHEPYIFKTPEELAPSGMMHRGSYKVRSLFTDDDDNEWLKWDWNLEIKKDWA